MENKNPFPKRETELLLKRRLSIPGELYFITLVEKWRRPGLIASGVANSIRAELDVLSAANDLELIAAVGMPDHCHFLGQLGVRLSISQCIGKLKARTRRALAAQGLEWQENYYEHLVRPDDDLEAIARYMLLNPYRRQLVGLAAIWPLWWRWPGRRFGFEDAIERLGRVPFEWLAADPPLAVARHR